MFDIPAVIAKHLRRGRQEDSHEFLRYAIDAFQRSCLAGQSPLVPAISHLLLKQLNLSLSKADPKIAETTWVHKIFGGKLRSRVTCASCGHNSDTFDNNLDLSLDIFKTSSIREAFRKFFTPDQLKGSDKYKCEKYAASHHLVHCHLNSLTLGAKKLSTRRNVSQ